MPDIDRAYLERRVQVANKLLDRHLGSIELASVSADGTVTVRFLGACSGCPLKPMTLAATVRRLLLDVKGVTRVEAVGVRISAEAEQSLAQIVGS